jgi:flavin-dependent dehydrogenase
LKFDVVIIGGSLAGAACARELVRSGIDATALERDTFPRPKVCGGFLSPNAVESLAGLELLNDVRAAGAVNVDHARVRAAGIERDVQLRRTGLGISRATLDHIVARGAPVRHGITVRTVLHAEDGFVIDTDKGEIRTPILVDAAGKLSRFTRRPAVAEFGIQHLESGTRGSALDFWFFEDGYGGAVTVENGLSNFCFLINKAALRRFISKPGCLCTGPLAYDRYPGDVIAIGDATGMIDPFCGEGMHHALDSGISAARVIARGLHDKRTYVEMKNSFEVEWSRRWAAKRLLAELLRMAVRRPTLVGRGFGWNPGWFLDRLWDRISA